MISAPAPGRRGIRRSMDMTFLSIDPASGERIQEYPAWGPERLEAALASGAAVSPAWGARPLPERAALMRRAGELLLQRRDEYALLMSREMGKVLVEAQAELEKSAKACMYYADEAPHMLADELIKTTAQRSL